MSINLDTIILNVEVLTAHEDATEFVIDDANDRNKKPNCFYYEKLAKMVEHGIRDTDSRLLGYEVYYRIILKIEIDSKMDIVATLATINRCVKKWKNIYKIDNFKNSYKKN